MQRSPSLPVIVHCSHHNRPVRAVRNTAIDRLVSCEESEKCRIPATRPDGSLEAAATFPRGCSVYPSLQK